MHRPSSKNNPSSGWFSHLFRITMAFGLAIIFPGCSAKWHKESADKEAAKLIDEKTQMVPNMPQEFTIDREKVVDLSKYPLQEESADFFGDEADFEVGARLLNLMDVLELAVKHNRTYQNQRESLYLEALSLSLSRWQYTPIFGAGGTATYTERATEVRNNMNQVIRDHESSVSMRGDTGSQMLLRSGGRIAASVTTDFFRFVSGNDKWARSSAISATLTQPLWRGAGYRAAIENLTQAERNLLYALRTFTRFRREFSVDIASQYYSVLQSRDRVRNEYIGYQNAIANAEEERAKLQEGQTTLTSLGLFEQSLLSSETRWINEIRNYKQNLDQFKILLGLPTNERIVLDYSELYKLTIDHPELDIDEVTEVALVNRLDLYNQRDQVVDAERKIYVASNNLKPDVNLVLSGGLGSDPNSGAAVPLPELDNYNYSAGLDVDLPLGIKDRRNNYRATIINLDRAQRQLELAEDQIKLAINNDWRALDQAKRNFEISEIGVQLSESRVDEQQILKELGQGTSRDLVQAQEDLVSSRNQRTNALVQHTISRLNLWRDMGILYIQDSGQWEEKELSSVTPEVLETETPVSNEADSSES